MTHHLVRHALTFIVDVGRLTIWLVLLVAIFGPLERLFALHPSKMWRKQSGVDLAWYFINSLLPAVVISMPLALLARVLSGINPGGFYSAVGTWPLWLRILLMLFVSDVGAYWGHRALHGPLLWRFHAIHHSAEHLDWLVNTRLHPIDMVVTRLSGLMPVYLLGLARSTGPHIDPTVAIVMIIGTLWTFFIHSNIRVRLGPLEWLVSSPVFHHWHHSNDLHRDQNFAFIFPVIDKIFGTAWLPKYWPPDYGIKKQVPSTLAGQFFDPFSNRMMPEREPAKESDK